MTDLLDDLHSRATAAGYAADFHEFESETGRTRRLIFWLPSEDDENRSRVILSPENATFVAESRFDDFRPLEDFEAIWSPTTGVMECALDSGQAGAAPFYLLDMLARNLGMVDSSPGAYAERDVPIEIPAPRDDLRISIQPGSAEFAILRPLFGRRVPLRPERMPRVPVLRIEGFYAASANDASAFLERIGNAVLFQLDLRGEIPLFLSRPAPLHYGAGGRRRRDPEPLRPPEYEYDPDPMALYWYGRTAHRMPLLQFLAFYQVVEYYFPVYSEAKVRDTLYRMLKDPRFDAGNPADLTRLMNQIKPGRAGRGYGDERAQLQATIQECITPEEIREFIIADERRTRFFDRSTGKKMPLVPVRIPVGSDDADLRPNAAERLYSIRCRIVHTKAGEDTSEKILLPFSREATLLRFDIDLMEFVARQVLISASRRLRLE